MGKLPNQRLYARFVAIIGGVVIATAYGLLHSVVAVPSPTPSLASIFPPSGPTRATIVARARSALGFNTVYQLGQGGSTPTWVHPGGIGTKKRCDCSGFVAWSLGLKRNQIGLFPGAWIETTRIFNDAKVTQIWFEEVLTPVAGDIIVYGDTFVGKKKKEGHVGIVTSVADGVAASVIQCSSKSTPDAITDGPVEGFWKARGAIFVRYKLLIEK